MFFTYENAEIIVDITVMVDVMDDYQIEDNLRSVLWL